MRAGTGEQHRAWRSNVTKVGCPGSAGPPNSGDGRFVHSLGRIELDGFVLASEFVAIDVDGYVDLLVGGHEQDGSLTHVLWGDSTGVYNSGKGTALPAVGSYGVVLDYRRVRHRRRRRISWPLWSPV